MTGIELGLGLAPSGDVVDDELREVLVAVADRDVLDSLGRKFSRPGRLARRSVAFQARPRCRDPVVEALAGIGEVAVPSERGRAVLIRVVGAEPAQVQCGELPDEFGVPMPERRHDGCGEPVRAS